MNIGNVAFKNDDHYLFLFTVKAGNRRMLGKQKITSRIVGKQYLLTYACKESPIHTRTGILCTNCVGLGDEKNGH